MRPCHRLCLLCLPLLLLAMTPLHAQDQKQLDDLKALFERDPATGFVEAQRLFEGPRRAGDLAGMMAILTVVTDWSERCSYAAPCLTLAEAALPVATARGDWAAVGNIRWAQLYVGLPVQEGWLRGEVILQRATEAYARAGKERPDFERWKAEVAPVAAQARDSKADWVAMFATFPAEIRALADSLVEAVENAEDSRASDLMMDLVGAVSDAPLSLRGRIAMLVCGRMWLPRSERLLPELRRWVVDAEKEAPGEWARMLDGVMQCSLAWSGRRDACWDTYNWCLHKVRNSAVPAVWPSAIWFLIKCMRMGQPEAGYEGLRVLMECPTPPDGARNRWLAAQKLIHPNIPVDLRRALVQKQLEYFDWALRTGQSGVLDNSGLGFRQWRIYEKAPEAERATWCLETGYQIADYAPNFPTAESRSRAATEAAAYFTKGGRPDLAAQAQEWAKVLAANDPKAQLQSALAAAQSAASSGKWEDVIKGLEPVMATAAPSGAAVQAALLLQQAQGKLGKPDEAAVWLSKAADILTQAKLPASERANTLSTLAALQPDSAKKLVLLKQAESAATEAGLGPLQEKISQQLAELALATGDLATAEKTLLDIINRLEAKREALAFDRVLRMQWFADNLGPYRKLLSVAAREKNAPLALWCGEKMRARALTDQLAWQKVDMGVRLPRDLQTRLSALREMRTKTYALLQRAMGGEQLTGGDVRGAYMPIRGAYMPIRGTLLGDKPLTEADLAELRGLLDTLAKEEEALASAIREQVPAYAEATTETPSGEDLVKSVAPEKDLAVLQYTLCDEGLVVVGMRGGQKPRVALISVKGEDLWQQIGKFRQDIWERKPEANADAMKLYNQLVLPVEGCLFGAKRLWVVADGALQLVPFGALIGSDRNYLVSRYAIATTPSLTLALASRGQREKGQGTVILAAPDTGAVAPALAETDDKRGMYMPIRGMYMPIRGAYMPIRGEGVSSALTMMASVPLPGAKAEGEAIAAQFQPSILLTDKAATKAKLLEAGSKCDLLHIATHGYADPDYPEFSGLLTAGEGEKPYDTLTAQEVYMWPLKARLVTLSACQTAMGKTVEGEGVMGLTRAFIFAGAQDVLCTLWPVADESTKALMTAFYENLKKDQPIEEALRNAQATLAGTKATSNPFFWAGFVAVRGPE